MPFAPTHIRRWTLPPSYFGATWEEWYAVGVSRNRDSGCIERSNFEVALERLGGESDTVRVVRESHFLVGWVEWIAVHQDDEAKLRAADEILARVKRRTILDEDHFSEMEHEEVSDYWQRASIKERLGLLLGSQSEASVFCARRADLPADDRLYEYLARA